MSSSIYPGVEVIIHTGTPNKRGTVRDIQDSLVCAELKDGSGCEWFFFDEVERIPKKKKPDGWLTYSPTFGVIPQEVADVWRRNELGIYIYIKIMVYPYLYFPLS